MWRGVQKCGKGKGYIRGEKREGLTNGSVVTACATFAASKGLSTDGDGFDQWCSGNLWPGGRAPGLSEGGGLPSWWMRASTLCSIGRET